MWRHGRRVAHQGFNICFLELLSTFISNSRFAQDIDVESVCLSCQFLIICWTKSHATRDLTEEVLWRTIRRILGSPSVGKLVCDLGTSLSFILVWWNRFPVSTRLESRVNGQHLETERERKRCQMKNAYKRPSTHHQLWLEWQVSRGQIQSLILSSQWSVSWDLSTSEWRSNIRICRRPFHPGGYIPRNRLRG